MKISIIIPIFNEAATICTLLSSILDNLYSKDNVEEILVVDGGSTDGSQKKVSKLSNEYITLIASRKGRAIQLNTGAKVSRGEILYFLHADSFPPRHFDRYIINEVQKHNHAGCFRMKFDSNHWWLRFLGWLTQFKSKRCRGGDQSQFITKTLFNEIGGYNESFVVYEDNELVDRLFALRQFVIIPKYITTSSRRYQEIGVWRLQYYFLNIHLRRWMGASSEDLYKYYLKKVLK
ncbi:TIGR04283 family arsenosugar biosynthesis glycosyltransferase [Aquimarina sp. U1-2]|uniref:TIGR04283 family arsenosugar biosynthesis glycosyltransferase n=1 Tax=Aquimarina sp. U1-2 TaxID=2823141 RepID=UPI001AECA42E|nr:TIGR04283 family arsenosugar biosynthesis glycosyltransferase [Aquimarina sp. U1-2]MBP2831722.1 TIGR04283 family arsenosugar biosynthesis glycosyltransferase [Aquimarina sp. U1-2]